MTDQVKTSNPLKEPEDWLQASEARYDSMTNLLQSVRHDIDALTSRIDQTQNSPQPPRKIGSTPPSTLIGESTDEVIFGQRPDLLANVNSVIEQSLRDLGEPEEYMDIRIRETPPPKHSISSEQLIECSISNGSPVTENKTWRSPSDFNLHDPFRQEDFGKEVSQLPSGPHLRFPVKETDLDDLSPLEQTDQHSERDESDGSLSPAVSPTFGNWNAEVNLNNMLVISDVAGHFQFEEEGQRTTDADGYQVYENDHALTTIDEASEETEDDISSSELEVSQLSERACENEPPSARLLERRPIEHAVSADSQSMNGEFKIPCDSTQSALFSHNGSHDAKHDSRVKVSHNIQKSDQVCDLPNATEMIVFRRKRSDNLDNGSPLKQRPISGGSLRAHVRSTEASGRGSLQSVLSTFSQESMVSEADSYVTVDSHNCALTGSDDIYTTAYSDSDLPTGRNTPEMKTRTGDDDCPTLGRKRTKLPRNQRHRPVIDSRPTDDYSSSSEEEGFRDGVPSIMDSTLVASPEPIVVMPKFSRLPTKLTSPKDKGAPSVIPNMDITLRNIPLEVETATSVNAQFPLTPTNTRASCGIPPNKRPNLQRPKRNQPPTLRGLDDASTHRSIYDRDSDSSDPDPEPPDDSDYDMSPRTGGVSPHITYKPGQRSNPSLTEVVNERTNDVTLALKNESKHAIPPVTETPKNGSSHGIVVIPKYILSSKIQGPESMIEHLPGREDSTSRDDLQRPLSRPIKTTDIPTLAEVPLIGPDKVNCTQSTEKPDLHVISGADSGLGDHQAKEQNGTAFVDDTTAGVPSDQSILAEECTTEDMRPSVIAQSKYTNSTHGSGRWNGQHDSRTTPIRNEPLPLGAVLASAEANAARPTIYASRHDNKGPYASQSNRFPDGIQPAEPHYAQNRNGTHMNDTITLVSRVHSEYPVNSSNDLTNNVKIENVIVDTSRHPDEQSYQAALRRSQDSSSLRTMMHSPRTNGGGGSMWTEQSVPSYHESQRPHDPRKSLEADQWSNQHPHQLYIETNTPTASTSNRPSMIPVGDIASASQRTSLIMHDPIDTSVRLVMAPQDPVRPHVLNVNGSRNSTSMDPYPYRGTTFGTPHSRDESSEPLWSPSIPTTMTTFRSPTASTPPRKAATPEDAHPQSQVKLIQAPHIISPLRPPDRVSLVSSPVERSRPIHVTETTALGSPTSLSGRRSSPPMIRPKWHLKPIPTDTEIRERLRSRSRQRVAMERQSRAQRTESVATYRPRSSRSDSRYRCTDLDSAIAESRADLVDTTQSSVRPSDCTSDTKQSASLFDLDAPRYGLALRSDNQEVGLNGSSVRSQRPALTDAKSYTSLLETDIDTGENYERPIVLETDVDNLNQRLNNKIFNLSLTDEVINQKARSLFNLTSSYTPSTHRRQINTEAMQTSKVSDQSRIGVTDDDNWQRTKSLQVLANGAKESPAPQPKGYRSYSQQIKTGGGVVGGAKGLIDRLHDRARSTHELRIAQSLSKLRVPEWLDKAECLSSDAKAIDRLRDSTDQSNQLAALNKASSVRERVLDRSRPFTLSGRSLSSVRRNGEAVDPKWLPKPTAMIETVAEPSRPRVNGSHQPRFVRPSREFRERGDSASRLRPIQSKLYTSMRSAAGGLTDVTEPRPQVAPRNNLPIGQSEELILSPQDFVRKLEPQWDRNTQRWQNGVNGQMASSSHVDYSIREDQSSTTDSLSALQPNKPQSPTSLPYLDDVESTNGLSNVVYRTEGGQLYTDNIKPADHDSGTEHSGEHSEAHNANMKIQDGQRGQINNGQTNQQLIRRPNMDGFTPVRCERVSEELNDHPAYDVDQEIAPAEWYSIDADGETESEATDGLDQISDLTCLTSLVDTCSTRHRALLANRHSALNHLLTSLGWWPMVPQAQHRYTPPTAAEAISIAAHEFNVDEDSHRAEFIKLLTGPESRRPINLGEFALNHLSASVQRKQEDGLLYISCGRSECTKPSVQVSHALDWRACANCYTLYCSPSCRAMDRRAFHDHPSVCSFARAKRSCNHLLRNLAPSQVTGLTALAKTGMTRLGRGGILLPFALVSHAEWFLQRARTQSMTRDESVDSSLEKAVSCWEHQHQPSPGGLMSPPLYLTLNELEELDSSVANPCRTYAPATSMVLIVVVCAYELIARSDGRPVHLFKQSIILPFPSRSTSHILQSPNPSASAVERQRQVVSNEPATNGISTRPSGQQQPTASAAREAFMIRLQRILRERGVSLRHHHPDLYTQVANFVETGQPFVPIRIVFHDFILQEAVVCTIQPMADPLIQPTREVGQHQQTQRVDPGVYEEISHGQTTKVHPQRINSNGARPTRQEEMKRRATETDF